MMRNQKRYSLFLSYMSDNLHMLLYDLLEDEMEFIEEGLGFEFQLTELMALYNLGIL